VIFSLAIEAKAQADSTMAVMICFMMISKNEFTLQVK